MGSSRAVRGGQAAVTCGVRKGGRGGLVALWRFHECGQLPRSQGRGGTAAMEGNGG